MASLEGMGKFLRAHGVTTAVALVLASLLGVGVRFVLRSKSKPKQERVHVLTARIETQEPPKPQPPPNEEPKDEPDELEEEQPQTRLIEVKIPDAPPPDAARSAPPAGQLGLEGQGTGPSDAFQLSGKGSGRDIREGGGISEGPADGVGGVGEGGDQYGYYLGRIAVEIQGAWQRNKKIKASEAKVDIRVWVDPRGELTAVQLNHSTGDDELDRELRGIVGMRLRTGPPPDMPQPTVYQVIVKRPLSAR